MLRFDRCLLVRPTGVQVIITHTTLPGRSQHRVGSCNLLIISAYLSRPPYGPDVDEPTLTENR